MSAFLATLVGFIVIAAASGACWCIGWRCAPRTVREDRAGSAVLKHIVVALWGAMVGVAVSAASHGLAVLAQRIGEAVLG